MKFNQQTKEKAAELDELDKKIERLEREEDEKMIWHVFFFFVLGLGILSQRLTFSLCLNKQFDDNNNASATTTTSSNFLH